jgi:hypothetical protein
MFDVIFNNIFILIPLAIFIGLRILDAQKKRKNASSQEDKQDTVEKDNEPPPFLSHWELEKKAQRRGVSPSGVPLPRAAPPPAPVLSIVETPPVAPKKTAASFLKNLDKLPPIKRAVVFSEILGPPKGLQEN